MVGVIIPKPHIGIVREELNILQYRFLLLISTKIWQDVYQTNL